MRSSDFGSIVSPLTLGRKAPNKSKPTAGIKRPRAPMPRMGASNPVGALSQARMKRKMLPRLPGALSAGRSR